MKSIFNVRFAKLLIWSVPIVLSSCNIFHNESEDISLVESPAGKMEYSKIVAPVFVGRPPSDAYIGLSKMENGEIRYYDYGEQSQLVVEEIRDEMRPAHSYIFSKDNGLNWKRKIVSKEFFGADVQSPKSKEYMRLILRHDSILVVRSQGGITGKWTKQLIDRNKYHMYAPPLFIRKGERVLVACHKTYPIHSYGVYYSDDDGFNWKFSEVQPVPAHVPGGVHLGPRWQNAGIEPTVVELSDGRLWMIIRCSQDNHYESFSNDGGETWTKPEPSRFYGTLTMPRIGRLHDGRLLFIWNNTTPLPEMASDNPVKAGLPATSKDGTWEDVFTNRAAIHAAISEDDGRSWIGFRELYLDPRRNASDYAVSGGVDHSVHQSQFTELKDGKVLVAFGQHPLHRAMVIFDPDWLYDKTRKSDFSNGLTDWCTHKFIAEIKGHCSFNRKSGAKLIPHPDNEGKNALQIGRSEDPSLLIQNDGAVWNFPSGKGGAFTTRIMLPKGSQGARINLTDRWFNPIDTCAYKFSMFTVDLCPLKKIGNSFYPEEDKWYNLKFEWNGLDDPDSEICKLFVDSATQPILLPLNRKSINGISYVHIISTANHEDKQGMLIESVEASVF